MIIKNCFYEKPKLLRQFCKLHEKRDVLQHVLHPQYHLIGTNSESCINEWVNHCIILYMRDHSNSESIDTKDCMLTRDELRHLILFGEVSPEYEIRSLKYVDDMVDLIGFILCVKARR
jgi:hypothetical protein